jgi:hypothetical protein
MEAKLTEDEIQKLWESSDREVVKAGIKYLGTKFFDETGINMKATRLNDDNRDVILENIEEKFR